MVSCARLCQERSEGGELKPRIAIVVAMARELRPLVKGWKREITAEGVTIYTSDRAIALYAGLGAQRAWLATTTALQLGPIRRIISAGWAGGLHEGIVPGGVWRVREVVDSATGKVMETTPANGIKTVGAVLVTANTVTSVYDKRRMRKMYSADLVDMEASAVGQVARKNRIPFSAIKAVSDAHDFDLPRMESFTSDDGQFHQATFATYVALRPTWWRPVARLARDSNRAARNLASELERYLYEEGE
jgi:adenosylhomocysteine nucleosidase